jgi:hypothetical protein
MNRLTVLLIFLFATFEVEALTYTLQRLFLNVPGGNLSLDNAWDINDSGDIVGLYFQSGTGTHGFTYNLETKTTTPMDFPGAEDTYAFGNNDSGDTVGKYLINGRSHAFIYDGTTFTTLFPEELEDGENQESAANDINDLGVIVGEKVGIGGFTHSDGVTAPLLGPTGEFAIPWGINDSGDIVGFYTDESFEQHGFIKSDAGYITLDHPDAVFGTSALSINNSGTVVGVYYVAHAADERGFIWKEGVGFSKLDFDATKKSKPTGINNSNDVVGTRVTISSYYGLGEPDPTLHFIWTGEAGNNDWHVPLNWNDKLTGEDATDAPGDLDGVETVEIVQSAVGLTELAHIHSIEVEGSLVVSGPLFIESSSSIENLTLESDLDIVANLSLAGDSSFSNGATIVGEGVLKQDGIALLEEGAIEVDIENSGEFSVETGGSITGDVTNTGIFEFGGDALEGIVENYGEFLIATDEGAILDVSGIDFRNHSEGTLSVVGDSAYELKVLENAGEVNIEIATLTVSGEVILRDGEIHLWKDATLIFKPSAPDAVRITDDVLISDTNSNGLQVVTSEFNIAANATLVTQVMGETGLGTLDAHMLLEGDDLVIKGGGSWFNYGGLFLGPDSTINGVEVVNDGTWFFDGDESTLSFLDANFLNTENGAVVIRSNLALSDNAHLTNRGYLTLDGTIGVFDNDLTMKRLDNFSEGSLFKEGNGETRLEVPVSNEGLIMVREGSLVFPAGIELHDQSIIYVAKDSTLSFDSDVDGAVYVSGESTVSGEGTTTLRYDEKNGGVGVALEFDGAGVVLTFEDGDLVWERGDINFGAGGESQNTQSTFVLSGSAHFTLPEPSFTLGSRAFTGNGFVSLMEGSSTEQTGDLMLGEGVVLKVSGVYTLNGTVWPYDYPDGSGIFHVADTGTLLANDKSGQCKIGTLCSFDGTVKVESNSSFFISSSFNTISNNSLLSGTWIIGKSSHTHIGVIGGDVPNISTLKSGVKVSLTGDARLNNFPVVIGGFTVEAGAELELITASFVATPKYLNSGTLNLDIGSVLVDDFFHNISTGVIKGNGFISGKVVSDGKIVPGSSPGTITIDGDYTQTETGVLEIEVFGATPGSEYDQLIVNGMAILGGTLHIIPQMDVQDGTPFNPLIAETVVGSFDRIVVAKESGRSTYDVTITGGGIEMTPKTLSVTSFSEWQNALFSEADAADEAVGQDDSDPDNDGYSNLFEYALDLNPWVSNTNPVEIEIIENGIDALERVSVRFPWAKEMTDAQYVVQISSDLIAWTNLSTELVDSVDNGNSELLTVEANVDPAPTDRLFARIRVETVQ